MTKLLIERAPIDPLVPLLINGADRIILWGGDTLTVTLLDGRKVVIKAFQNSGIKIFVDGEVAGAN